MTAVKKEASEDRVAALILRSKCRVKVGRHRRTKELEGVQIEFCGELSELPDDEAGQEALGTAYTIALAGELPQFREPVHITLFLSNSERHRQPTSYLDSIIGLLKEITLIDHPKRVMECSGVRLPDYQELFPGDINRSIIIVQKLHGIRGLSIKAHSLMLRCLRGEDELIG